MREEGVLRIAAMNRSAGGMDESLDLAYTGSFKEVEHTPYINIKAGQTAVLAEMEGPGAIKHIWMTPTGQRRFSIIRIYWDDEKEPSVECPVGDFFANGWGGFAQVSSIPVTVNPGSAFNCYWVMK